MGRSIHGAALVDETVLLAAASASAQSKTLTVVAYSGSRQQLRKNVIPAFAQKHGVKVEYPPVTSVSACVIAITVAALLVLDRACGLERLLVGGSADGR